MSTEAKPFGTPEQLSSAEDALRRFAESYPEASAALKNLWKQQYLEVGHKALGRMLLGKSAADLAAKSERHRE